MPLSCAQRAVVGFLKVWRDSCFCRYVSWTIRTPDVGPSESQRYHVTKFLWESDMCTFQAGLTLGLRAGIPEGASQPIAKSFPQSLVFKQANITAVAVGNRKGTHTILLTQPSNPTLRLDIV